MRLICVLAVLCGGSWCLAADPVKFTVESKLEPRFQVVENKVKDLEARVARLEGKPVLSPAAATPCKCGDGQRCVCGAECLCADRPTGGVESGAKASTPKLVQWHWQGQTCWLPEGYSIPGGTKATASQAWDCSSGVCRPASAGSCASGSCGTSYGSSPVYGVGSFGGGGCSGGACSGGSCGSSAGFARGGFFRR